ncbi:hypothetical protein FRC08_001125 [Ceratobasidium sp. 394]|nr:hypothetical protein FRC08_001125 [Ceratobasidium sp. 394]
MVVGATGCDAAVATLTVARHTPLSFLAERRRAPQQRLGRALLNGERRSLPKRIGLYSPCADVDAPCRPPSFARPPSRDPSTGRAPAHRAPPREGADRFARHDRPDDPASPPPPSSSPPSTHPPPKSASTSTSTSKWTKRAGGAVLASNARALTALSLSLSPTPFLSPRRSFASPAPSTSSSPSGSRPDSRRPITRDRPHRRHWPGAVDRHDRVVGVPRQPSASIRPDRRARPALAALLPATAHLGSPALPLVGIIATVPSSPSTTPQTTRAPDRRRLRDDNGRDPTIGATTRRSRPSPRRRPSRPPVPALSPAPTLSCSPAPSLNDPRLTTRPADDDRPQHRPQRR